MSFDVFAQSFQNGDTGNADANSVRTILSAIPHKHDPQFDSYDIEFSDGSELEMYMGGLDGKKPFTGAMFALRDISEPIGDFIFRFSQASGCVLLPAMEPACVLLTNEDQSKHLPSDMRDAFQVITISSGAELLAALEGGYDTWRAYCDRVVGGRPEADGGQAR